MTIEQREELRRKIRERAEERRKRMVPTSPAPRYDDVFFAGIARLDSIARGVEEWEEEWEEE